MIIVVLLILLIIMRHNDQQLLLIISRTARPRGLGADRSRGDVSAESRLRRRGRIRPLGGAGRAGLRRRGRVRPLGGAGRAGLRWRVAGAAVPGGPESPGGAAGSPGGPGAFDEPVEQPRLRRPSRRPRWPTCFASCACRRLRRRRQQQLHPGKPAEDPLARVSSCPPARAAGAAVGGAGHCRLGACGAGADGEPMGPPRLRGPGGGAGGGWWGRWTKWHFRAAWRPQPGRTPCLAAWRRRRRVWRGSLGGLGVS